MARCANVHDNLCLCCGAECLLLLPQAKLVGAQSRLRSVDVELLTKLCKELRQQFSDEVSYDGARLTPKTVRGASFAFPSDAVACWYAGEAYTDRLADKATKRALASFDDAMARQAFG